MRLTGIRLENITCFRDLSLDFTNDHTGKPASWIVLLGENGTGKSTILQMIGGALLIFRQLSVLAGDVNWLGYLRDQSTELHLGRIKLDVQRTTSDDGFTGDLFNAHLPQNILSISRLIPFDHVDFGPGDNLLTSIYADQLTLGWFACGYSPWRRITRRTNGSDGALPTLKDSAKPFRFASLFGDSSNMTDVPDWLAGLYFKAIFPDSTDADKKRFEDAKRALLSALPHVTDLEVNSDRQVIVTEGNTHVPLERLSDGYRGTISWIGDLIRRLFDAFPNSPNPLHERGVVLVDEIDLHLHPKWQRSIVQNVRKLFPNLQFIVTTHSPFVAQDLRPEDKIIVLEKSKSSDSVVVREDAGAIQDWSADQILSAYFGLENGTRGEEAQRSEARYQKLLELEVSGKLTRKQRTELDRLRETLDRVPVGTTPDEQSFFRVADETVAMLRRRREELEAIHAQNGNGHSVTEDQGA